MSAIPLRPFGNSGVSVSALGLGGSTLAKVKSYKLAERIVNEAIEGGITFFDNAWEYADGKAEEWMGKALGRRRDSVFLMSKVCTHGRDKATAMKQLEESLNRLRTDYLDLWQIHELAYPNDPDRHLEPGGAVEALIEAKAAGKVRFIGFTGHKHPEIHMRMLAADVPFDAVQMPLNVFDGTFRSFECNVLPEVNRRGMAALGMKTFNGDGRAVKAGVVSPEEALRYAMSLPVAVTITGIDSIEVLKQNLGIATDFVPCSPEEMRTLRMRVKADADDGRYELYKSSMHYDGRIGREQHGFPTEQELRS
jgi:aryl-alcohol dehydrogenase-like predicted oxidoreductase